MKPVTRSFFLLASVVLIALVCVQVNGQDFSYLNRTDVPWTYDPDSRDQPLGAFPRPHKRSHLRVQYRYNCPNDQPDCSEPFYEPNVKRVSHYLQNIIPTDILNPRRVNNLHLAFAHAPNHDIARYGYNIPNSPVENIHWRVPYEDPLLQWYNNNASNSELIRNTNFEIRLQLRRNSAATNTGRGTGNPKNTNTNGPIWWDLDPMYGTTSTAVNGKMNASNGDLLTAGPKGLFVATPNYNHLAVPGFYALLVKEHNWYAAQVRALYPNLNGTHVFRLARRWVTAVYQAILWYEYAPILFTAEVYGALEAYPGYEPDADFGTPVESILLSKYPYSEFGDVWTIADENYNIIDMVPVRGYVMNATNIDVIYNKYGLESILRGAIVGVQHSVDLYQTDAFKTPYPGHASGDLFSRMLARSREIGMPSHNDIRESYDLPRYISFNDFAAKNPALTPQQLQALKFVYDDDINKLDFWVGGHAEYRTDAHMGETFTAVYKRYWLNIRKNDKWWFEGDAAMFTAAEKETLRNMKISTLILKHTNITRLPCSSFFSRAADCPPAPQKKCATDNAPNTLLLADDQITLKWLNMTSGSNQVEFTVSAPTEGFIGVGFPKIPGKMLGADVFISNYFPANGTVATRHYNITDRFPCNARGRGVCPASGKYNVQAVSGRRVNGLTEVTFRVSPVTPGTNFSIISSFGSTQELSYHGPNKGTGTIDILVTPPIPPTTAAPTCPQTVCPSTAAPVKCTSYGSIPQLSLFLSLFLFVLSFF